MSALKLVLKWKWYNMIASGEKKEEYREITAYWLARLFYICDSRKNLHEIHRKDAKRIIEDWEQNGLRYGNLWPKHNSVDLFAGYETDRPTMRKEIRDIEIREGKPEWGAQPGKKYFVIELK